MCSGSIDGLNLSALDSTPMLIGDWLWKSTRCVPANPAARLGAKELSVRAIQPTETVIECLSLRVDCSLGTNATNRSVVSRPVAFTAEQFDTLSLGTSGPTPQRACRWRSFSGWPDQTV